MVTKEYKMFTSLVDRLLAVPHSVIRERIQAHRESAAQNPSRRGPKPKRKSSKRVSRAPFD